jgi:uncharacterized protein with ParB-like and HNH nuclease domain
MDISPDKQNIDRVFSNTPYYIDFYQRQYKWTEEPVKRLLDDVFYKFNDEYQRNKDSDLPLDQLIGNYSWYYLNTYVTNKINGKLYVVDGQQRLTTLTLILIKLKHLAAGYKSELEEWISDKIAGRSGYKKEFWMKHDGHVSALQKLFEGINPNEIDTAAGVTSVNLCSNYKLIDKWLNDNLPDKHKFESFVFYLMNRLVLINLNVEQTEVPMVFEVINDRGVRLKPYEILKGKLLGQISKEELDKLGFNEIWENQVSKVNAFKEDEIDQFFVYFLKSKLSNTRGEAVKFDKDYHRAMFEDDVNKVLKLKHNPKGVKTFLKNDFTYYTNLYTKIWGYSIEYNENYATVYYNALTDMDTRYLIILSCCTVDDPQEEEKIRLISYHLDRLFSLLQLQRSYNSNDFTTSIYKLSAELRNKDADRIELIFNKYLLELLSSARGVNTEEPLSYSLFKETGIELDKRFKRYFFARIEKFIAGNTNMQMKQTLYDLVQNTGSVKGFHIEHILSENSQNKEMFKGDPEAFERERNRLGGLLLLKGKDNISSSNETYKKKLKSYANTLYWNETLREDTYKSKLDFKSMIAIYNLNFRPMNEFGPDELEERHRLLFEMVKIIWK